MTIQKGIRLAVIVLGFGMYVAKLLISGSIGGVSAYEGKFVIAVFMVLIGALVLLPHLIYYLFTFNTDNLRMLIVPGLVLLGTQAKVFWDIIQAEANPSKAELATLMIPIYEFLGLIAGFILAAILKAIFQKQSA